MSKTTAEIVEQLKNMTAAAMANGELAKMIYCYPTVFTRVRWDKRDEFDAATSMIYPSVYGCDMEDATAPIEVFYGGLCAEWVQDCIDDGTLYEQVEEIEKGLCWVNDPENIEMLKAFA